MLLLQDKYVSNFKKKLEDLKSVLQEPKKDSKIIIHSPIFFNDFRNRFFDEINEIEKNSFLKQIAPLLGHSIFITSIGESIYVIKKDKIIKAKNYLSYDFEGKKLSIFKDLNNMKIEGILVYLDASPYYYGKIDDDFNEAVKISKKNKIPFINVKPYGFYDGNVYAGNSFVLNKEGKCVGIFKSFKNENKVIDLDEENIHFKSPDKYESIYNAIKCGLKNFFENTGVQNAVIGLSGGIDSALVLTIAVNTLGKDNVFPMFLPSMFTSTQSRKDAIIVSNILGVKLKETPIDRIFNVSRDTLLPIFGQKPFDITEENMQSRIRGYLLMAYANRVNGIVIATGNKSEIAMGYCTLYGDTVGGIAPIGDLLKKDVYALAKWINENVMEVFNESLLLKPPSAELRKDQKDEDDLPPYKILDEVLEMIFGGLSYDEIIKNGIKKEILEDIIKRIRKSEFKRRQIPISIKVSKYNFGNIKIPFESEV